MFIRSKSSGPRTYLQIVENRRERGSIRQKVIATLGRLDVLQRTGQLDSLLRSGMRFSEKMAILDSYEKGQVSSATDLKIGLPLVFGRLWKELGIGEVIEGLLGERKFQFSVERAVFLTVLNRGQTVRQRSGRRSTRSKGQEGSGFIICIVRWDGWGRSFLRESNERQPPSHHGASKT
jgi:hypothetical protein